MCDPVTGTLAAISAVAGIAGSIKQGMDAKSASNFNAKVANDEATQQDQQTAFDVQQQQDQSRRQLATQKAQFGASGVVADTGSPDAVAADDTKQAELDALAIKYGGALKARAYRSEASQDQVQASQAIPGSIFQAGSTLATRGSELYTAYHPPGH